jgi:hypothetical protein
MSEDKPDSNTNEDPSPASIAAASYAVLFLREKGADIAADGVEALVQYFTCRGAK